MTDLRASARAFSAWITPALLFSVPVELLTGASGGIWIGLLVVVSPLLGLVLAPRPGARASAHPASTIALALVGSVLLCSNFLLIGDMALALGFSRSTGLLGIAAAVFLVTVWGRHSRWEPVLALAGLLALLLPLGIVGRQADRAPLAAWNYAASPAAFRFSSQSPWVTEGRPITPRRGTETLLFEEEHRITPLTAGPLRILVSDGGRIQVQEWTLAANESVTVRPGDRLALEPGLKVRFEANKRIPGASEVGWARRWRASLGVELLSLLGSGLTLVGGAAALLAVERPAALSRAAAAIAGAGYFVTLAWAQGWAIYTASLAPETFLGGVAPEKLLELPTLALRGGRWGAHLGGLAALGAVLLLLASASALRDLVSRARLRGWDVGLWGALVGGAIVGSLGSFDPWSVQLIAFGLAASTLAPLAWMGIPPDRPRVVAVAVGAGGCVFLALVAAGQLFIEREVWFKAILNYPALVAAPVTAFLLWRFRPSPAASGLSSSPTWTTMKSN